jgi:hypothetical protein
VSYCRPDGTRRRTESCSRQRNTLRCSDGKESYFSCVGACPTEPIDGVWQCPIMGPIVCDPQKTTVEACDPEWGIWKPTTRRSADECGKNCGLVDYLYECNAKKCGPNENKNYQRRYDVPCKLPTDKCGDGGEAITIINNDTPKQLFVQIRLAGQDLVAGEAFDVVTVQYFVVNPFAQIQIPRCCDLTQSRVIRAGVVGQLANAQYFDSEAGKNMKDIKSIVYAPEKRRCQDYEFYLDDKKCDDVPEIPVPTTDLGDFLKSDPLSRLHLAELTLQNSLSQFYRIKEKDGTRGFTSDIEPFTFTLHQDGKFFKLYQGEKRLDVMHMGKSYDLFQIEAIRAIDTVEVQNAFFMSFFAYDPSIGQIVNNRGPPILSTDLNLCVDGCLATIVTLQREVAERYLDLNPRAKMHCCLDSTTEDALRCCDDTTKKSCGLNSICKGTKYDTTTNRPFAECTLFMKDDWCARAENKLQPECACFPTGTNTVEERVAAILAKDVIPQARVCLIPACKDKTCAYLPNELRNAECTSACTQMQNAINEGALRNIQFDGVQTLKCGIKGQFLTLKPVKDDGSGDGGTKPPGPPVEDGDGGTKPPVPPDAEKDKVAAATSARKKTIIGASTGGIIVLAIIVVAIILRKRHIRLHNIPT